MTISPVSFLVLGNINQDPSGRTRKHCNYCILRYRRRRYTRWSDERSNGDIKYCVRCRCQGLQEVRIRNDRAQNKAKSDGKRYGNSHVDYFERNAQTKRFRSEYKQKKNKFVTLQKAGADKYDKADDEQREKRTFPSSGDQRCHYNRR